ncbi:MAG: SUMF1/EgtB/PvdO family nonheme iron enzyme [Calditrichaeota bacterium]|nr:SUMF1/EgtB/PvdO family nonheme iron enzyme [Calditrichota bacterium]
MKKGNKKGLRKYIVLFVFLMGGASVILFNQTMQYSSENEFCESCHVHPQATQSWRLGNHYDNKSGVIVGCVDCHLPPQGWDYLQAKAITGVRDFYGYMFKDSSDFNWQQKSGRDAAEKHVYKAACLHCHQNLFPRTLSKKGEEAHLYYDQKSARLRCINCHLETGHFHDKKKEQDLSVEMKKTEKYTYPAWPDSFVDFKERIPDSFVDFEMVAVPGGEFEIGSPADEEFRDENEGPRRRIKISPFWMGKIEVSWDEYAQFYKETASQGRSEDQIKQVHYVQEVDGITGPTPAYGNPDQGWGRGKRPAITMTHFAARTYCEWLSQKTGKNYRLPTEAEWEYACRAGTENAYFFEGSPSDYSEKATLNKFFGADTGTINRFIIYALNSNSQTHLPQDVKANPFGLINMLGNAREFCGDYYQEDIYKTYPKDQVTENPKGPASGQEFVVRGGSFKSDASKTRSAARDFTRQDAWLVTDPQIPKSRWWYSDCNDVGFRVVCEYPVQKN